jgi:hypothetical protein
VTDQPIRITTALAVATVAAAQPQRVADYHAATVDRQVTESERRRAGCCRRPRQAKATPAWGLLHRPMGSFLAPSPVPLCAGALSR